MCVFVAPSLLIYVLASLYTSVRLFLCLRLIHVSLSLYIYVPYTHIPTFLHTSTFFRIHLYVHTYVHLYGHYITTIVLIFVVNVTAFMPSGLPQLDIILGNLQVILYWIYLISRYTLFSLIISRDTDLILFSLILLSYCSPIFTKCKYTLHKPGIEPSGKGRACLNKHTHIYISQWIHISLFMSIYICTYFIIHLCSHIYIYFHTLLY